MQRHSIASRSSVMNMYLSVLWIAQIIVFFLSFFDSVPSFSFYDTFPFLSFRFFAPQSTILSHTPLPSSLSPLITSLSHPEKGQRCPHRRQRHGRARWKSLCFWFARIECQQASFPWKEPGNVLIGAAWEREDSYFMQDGCDVGKCRWFVAS